MMIGPGGFEPPLPVPKTGVLPLDDGPATESYQNLQGRLNPSCRRAPTESHRDDLRHVLQGGARNDRPTERSRQIITPRLGLDRIKGFVEEGE